MSPTGRLSRTQSLPSRLVTEEGGRERLVEVTLREPLGVLTSVGGRPRPRRPGTLTHSPWVLLVVRRDLVVCESR